MKIALVCKNYAIERGGMERYTVLLGRQLLEAGHEVHVFANTWQDEPRIITHRVPIIRFSSPLKSYSFAYFAARELKKMKFDIIHAVERILHQDIYRVSMGISPVQIIQCYPNPLVRWFKSIGPRRLVLKCLEKHIFTGNGCKIIMTNSEMVKKQVIDHYGVNPDKIIVIYNGVDTSKFNIHTKEKYRASIRHNYGIDNNKSVIIFVSNDFKLKRLQTILEAMTLLDENYMLMVIGNGKKKNYLRWVTQNGLKNRVLLLGPKKNMEKYYAAADLFVLPTTYDAFANVCLEAMACGLPVITTKTNGFAEVIDEGETGFIVESRNPGELAGKIKALEPESERIRIEKLSSARARDFTTEKHIAQVLSLYENVRR